MKRVLLLTSLLLVLFAFPLASGALAKANDTVKIAIDAPSKSNLSIKGGNHSSNGNWCQFTVPKGDPQLLTISVIPQKEQFIDFDFIGSNDVSGMSDLSNNPREILYRGVFNPGTYTYYVYSYESSNVEVKYSTTVKSDVKGYTGYKDSDNDSLNAKGVKILTSGKTFKGAIEVSPQFSNNDSDFVIFKVDSNSEIELSFKALDFSFDYNLQRIYGKTGDFSVDGTVDFGYGINSRLLTNPLTTRTRYTIGAGYYALEIFGSEWKGDSGRYEVSFRTIKKTPAVQLTAPKTFTLAKDYGYDLFSNISYEYPIVQANSLGHYMLMPAINTPTCNPKGIVQVYKYDNGDFGLYGIKNGTTTVTIKTKDGKQTVSFKVIVKDNVFTRTTPLSGSEKKVYTSTKKLSYDSKGNMIAEIFILNKTGKTISSGANDLMLQMYAGTTEKYLCFKKNVKWVPTKPLKNGAYTTAKFTISRAESAYHGDLTRGEIEVRLDYWYNVKSTSANNQTNLFKSLTSKDKGVKEVSAIYVPMPERTGA